MTARDEAPAWVVDVLLVTGLLGALVADAAAAGAHADGGARLCARADVGAAMTERLYSLQLPGHHHRADEDPDDDDTLGEMCAARRYVTAAVLAALLRGGHAESAPFGARTFDIVTLRWTDWYGVSDDDPRVNTVVRERHSA